MDVIFSIPYFDKKRNREPRFLCRFYNFYPKARPPQRSGIRFFTLLHPQSLGDQAALVGFDEGF